MESSCITDDEGGLPCRMGVDASCSDCNCPDRVVTVNGELTGISLCIHSSSRFDAVTVIGLTLVTRAAAGY